MLSQPFYTLSTSLPQRARWALFRRIGGQQKKWLQWIYDSDGEYSLRSMRERNCIFFHIPKAAGISISHALLGNKGGAHSSAADYLSVFGAPWFDQSYKFTFVRDPATRLVSAYDFLRKGGFHDSDRAFGEAKIRPYETVSDFVENGLEQPEIRRWNHFRDQTELLLDPRNGRLAVDFIGRFETIEQDFETVRETLGVSVSLQKKNARAVKEKDPALELSPAALKKLREAYRRDYSLLGYE